MKFFIILFAIVTFSNYSYAIEPELPGTGQYSLEYYIRANTDLAQSVNREVRSCDTNEQNCKLYTTTSDVVDISLLKNSSGVINVNLYTPDNFNTFRGSDTFTNITSNIILEVKLYYFNKRNVKVNIVNPNNIPLSNTVKGKLKDGTDVVFTTDAVGSFTHDFDMTNMLNYVVYTDTVANEKYTIYLSTAPEASVLNIGKTDVNLSLIKDGSPINPDPVYLTGTISLKAETSDWIENGLYSNIESPGVSRNFQVLLEIGKRYKMEVVGYGSNPLSSSSLLVDGVLKEIEPNCSMAGVGHVCSEILATSGIKNISIIGGVGEKGDFIIYLRKLEDF